MDTAAAKCCHARMDFAPLFVALKYLCSSWRTGRVSWLLQRWLKILSEPQPWQQLLTTVGNKITKKNQISQLSHVLNEPGTPGGTFPKSFGYISHINIWGKPKECGCKGEAKLGKYFNKPFGLPDISRPTTFLTACLARMQQLEASFWCEGWC